MTVAEFRALRTEQILREYDDESSTVFMGWSEATPEVIDLSPRFVGRLDVEEDFNVMQGWVSDVLENSGDSN